MNWNAIAAVGQLLGTFAVFVTIIYLAIQVRHARQQLVRAERQSRWSSLRETFLATATHPELASATNKANKGLGFPPAVTMKLGVEASLTETEAFQINQMAWAIWTNTEQLVDSFEHQSLGQQAQTRHRVRQQFTSTYLARWYELAKDALNPDAVQFIDKLLNDRA